MKHQRKRFWRNIVQIRPGKLDNLFSSPTSYVILPVFEYFRVRKQQICLKKYQILSFAT